MVTLVGTAGGAFSSDSDHFEDSYVDADSNSAGMVDGGTAET